MSVDPKYLAAVATTDVSASYYALCNEFPLRLGERRSSLAKTAILKAAAAASLPLGRMAGPGAAYRLLSLPKGLSLNVIVQSGGTIETDLTVEFAGTPQREGFVRLCHSVRTFAGHLSYEPPYPRPHCLSADEVVSVIKRFDQITRTLEGLASPDQAPIHV